MTMPKFAAKDAEIILTRLDKLASTIQSNHEAWGMPFETAKAIVNDLDKTADTIEIATFGADSFASRQAEVIQRDADEPYMKTFENVQAPIQTESDEPYMKEYSVDTSSDVRHGVSSTGRKLAP